MIKSVLISQSEDPVLSDMHYKNCLSCSVYLVTVKSAVIILFIDKDGVACCTCLYPCCGWNTKASVGWTLARKWLAYFQGEKITSSTHTCIHREGLGGHNG